jgi:hypothetical protein
MRKKIGEWWKQERRVTESVKWRLKRFSFDPNEHMLEWRSSQRARGHVCFWVSPNWLETKIFNFSFHLTQELLQYIYSSVLSFKVRTHLKKPWSVKCTKFYDKWCGWTEKLWQLFFFFLNSKTNFIKPQHLPQEVTGRAKQIQDKEGLRCWLTTSHTPHQPETKQQQALKNQNRKNYTYTPKQYRTRPP